MRISHRSKTAIALGTAGLLVLTLSGCGQKVGGGDATSGAGGDVVDYWTSWPADTPQAKIWKEAADAFKAESGITVKIRELGGTAQQDIINASATGDGPDMYDNAPDHVPAFREAGLVADLSDVLKAKPFGEDETIDSIYPESVITAASDDKGLAFVPHTILSGGVWFDAAKHPELSENPPKTWDDLLSTFDKLKASGEVPIAQEGGNSSYNVLWFYWLMLRDKGAGAVLDLSSSADAWGDPGVLKAAQQVDLLRTKGYFQDGYEGSRYPNAQNAWAQGDYAVDLNGSWLAGEVKSVLPEGAKLSTFPFPEYGAGNKVEELNTLGWTVNPKGSNADGAKQFIEFLVQKKYIDKVGTDALNIPARSDVKAPESLAAMQQAVLDTSDTTGYMDTAAANAPTWYKDVLLPLSDQLIFGKITPQQFVEQGKEKTDAYVKAGTK